MPQGPGTYGTQRGRPSTKKSVLRQDTRGKKPHEGTNVGRTVDIDPDKAGIVKGSGLPARTLTPGYMSQGSLNPIVGGTLSQRLGRKSAFTMRSGNSPMFKHMGSSPVKTTTGVNHIHEDGTIHDKDGNDKGTVEKGTVEKSEEISPMDFTYAGKDYKNVGEYVKTLTSIKDPVARKAKRKKDFGKTKVGQAWQEIKGIFSKK